MRFTRLALVALFVLLPLAAGATYTQQYTLSQDATFQGQVTVASIQTCANRMSEAPTVTGHNQVMAFCTRLLQNPTQFTTILSVVIASQSNNPMTPLSIPSTVADSLIQSAMDAQMNNVAGYFKQ